MTDDSNSAHNSGMHRGMLLCCGAMVVIFGAFGISSVAAAIGLSTGQTYLTIAGFAVAAVTLIAYLYRKWTSDRDGTSQSLENA